MNLLKAGMISTQTHINKNINLKILNQAIHILCFIYVINILFL